MKHSKNHLRTLRWAAASVAALGLLQGCAGHASRTQAARSALDAGRPAEAVAHLNEELEVSSAEQLPADTGGDAALLVLDRAMILQQMQRYELSARDLQVADKQIEMLDFSRGTLDDIGKYVFSDETGPYQAPAYEKLMINTMNMVNYLVRHDSSGARVEARRLSVMQDFLANNEGQGASLLGPGSYLAGFTFEKSGKADEALRYYDDALRYGDYRTLQEPICRLAERAGYRSPRIERVLQRCVSDSHPEEAESAGEVLLIVSYGRVPAKHAKRVPIGLALTMAGGYLSPRQRSRANYLAGQGLVTWVNYPELGKSRGSYGGPRVVIDGREEPAESVIAIEQEARQAWEKMRGVVIASAITRMITRVAAGEVTRRASGGGVAGALLSLGTQAAMTVADTPDTRSWSTLPARMAIVRKRVPPGEHTVTLSARGAVVRKRLEVRPGGWAAASLTVLH